MLGVLDRTLAGRRKRRRPGFRGIVLGAQAQGDQRKRIDLAGALQLLLALKAFEGAAAILIPHAAGLFGFQITLGHQRLLNLLIPLWRWSHLPGPPGRWPPLPAAPRGGRSGSSRLTMAPICHAGFGVCALILAGNRSPRGVEAVRKGWQAKAPASPNLAFTAWPAGIRQERRRSRWLNSAPPGARRGTARRRRVSTWLAPFSSPRCC